MTKLSGKKSHSGINPMGGSKGKEYQSDWLQLNYGTVKVPAGSDGKSAMIDGPFGGKVNA